MNDGATAIQRSIDYIEDHLHEPVTVADFAAAAGYSVFHFIRTFNQIVRHTPYDYLIRRRLSEAAVTLVKTSQKIIDIAADFDFHSAEVFTRAFRRMFAVQPSEFRAVGRLDPNQMLSRRTPAHLTHFNHPGFRMPIYEARAGVQIAGLMGRVLDERKDMERLSAAASAVLGEDKPFKLKYIRLYPPGWEISGAFLMAGAELEGEAPLPLASLHLPAGPYACMAHRGSLDALGLTRDFLYQTWLPGANLQWVGAIEIIDALGEMGCENFNHPIYLSIPISDGMHPR